MMVCSVVVAASVFPSVFVVKSPCEGCDEAGAAGRRAGAVFAAGAVGAAVEAESSAMAARGSSLNEISAKKKSKKA